MKDIKLIPRIKPPKQRKARRVTVQKRKDTAFSGGVFSSLGHMPQEYQSPFEDVWNGKRKRKDWSLGGFWEV